MNRICYSYDIFRQMELSFNPDTSFILSTRHTEPVPAAARPKTYVCDSSPVKIVGSNPTGYMLIVCCDCCVLSGRDLCDTLISRPGEFCRLWCVVMCDLETSWMRLWPNGGGCRAKKEINTSYGGFSSGPKKEMWWLTCNDNTCTSGRCTSFKYSWWWALAPETCRVTLQK